MAILPHKPGARKRAAPRNARSPAPPRGVDTRIGLLEAAERILLEEGIQALTVRRIGAVSQLNPTLVTYHFGTVSGLLSELCRISLEPMLEEWNGLLDNAGQFSSTHEVLVAWLTPLVRPAAFTQNGRTLIVLDEIAAHGDPELRARLLAPMLQISACVQAALRPFTRHLTPRELRAWVRFISAAALGPPPRARIALPEDGQEPLDGVGNLIAFAEAALTGTAGKAPGGV